MLRTFEKDEAHAIGAGIEPARIEQLEVEAAQPRVLDRDQRRSLRLGVLDQARPASRAVATERFGMRADEARDQESCRRSPDRWSRHWPGRWSAALLIHHIENARPLGLPQAQIFVASRRQAMQMTEQPVPDARFAAVAFPDNGDGGHGQSPRDSDRSREGAEIALAALRAQAMSLKRVAPRFTYAALA